MVTQHHPVGPDPTTGTLLLGALMYAPAATAAIVLTTVIDDDLDDPAAATVLAAMRTLIEAGMPAGPQLVLDELRRAGSMTNQAAGHLRNAVTCGAEPLALASYAAATVAESLRRRCESAGKGLVELADTAGEADLVAYVERQAADVAECAGRLATLRGGAE